MILQAAMCSPVNITANCGYSLFYIVLVLLTVSYKQTHISVCNISVIV